MLINDLMDAFRQGRALANPATWANTTAATGALSGVLVGGFHVAKAFGYDFGESDAQLNTIAGGVATLVLLVGNILHVIANQNAGLPPKSADRSSDSIDSAGGPDGKGPGAGCPREP